MYRAAIRSIFSELLRQDRLVAIEKPVLEKPKTKEIDPLENLYKQPTLDEMIEMHLKSEKNKKQPRI